MKTMMFRSSILTLSILGLASGCAPHDDAKDAPTPPEANVAAASSDGPVDPEPEPEPEVETVTVAVASVQLQDDCPQPAAAAGAAAQAPAQGKRSMPKPGLGDVEGDVAHGDMDPAIEARLAARCVQSEVQLSITSEDSEALPFSIRAVRLRKGEEVDADGPIQTMTARAPRIWKGSSYAAWDQSIAPGSTLNVRYSLGAPDWAAVEKILSGSSWEWLYVVELEVEVAGRVQTIRSPLTPREAVEEMVT